jgi:hypothetical protein
MSEDARVHITDTEKAVRAHLRSHNGSVLAASGMALVFSSIGWAVLYGTSYWLTMFALAIANQGEGGMPAVFNTVFLGTAAVLMIAARVDQYFFPSDRAVDERPPVEHLADLLFFVPRFTMSCWQSLGALAWLARDERREAARLMDQLKTGGRVSLQELPASFPDERALRRMLDALLVTGLVDQRREKSLTWLHLGALAPDVFRLKAGTPPPEDPLAGVAHVKIRQHERLPSRPEDAGEV